MIKLDLTTGQVWFKIKNTFKVRPYLANRLGDEQEKHPDNTTLKNSVKFATNTNSVGKIGTSEWKQQFLYLNSNNYFTKPWGCQLISTEK